MQIYIIKEEIIRIINSGRLEDSDFLGQLFNNDNGIQEVREGENWYLGESLGKERHGLGIFRFNGMLFAGKWENGNLKDGKIIYL